ncbi:MAG: 16S rRNA (adenine(1518)-N(6)/adenine(1519)-N(6))-dimethyltransferase RsmA [bacterium]|nr:16S rRNA (adenine(1518)-N(6)/adenine(1519)-N(6))-dimethyltransferase RsmA [bacterium]
MKPKKSLGQNFLRDTDVLEKIIQSANLKSDDLVIEIGPGEGVLTEKLFKHAGKVLAIELDSALANKLKKQYKDSKKIEIINADILNINLPEILKVETRHCLVSTEEKINYKVVANIPYYITSPIIQLFLETKFPPTEMILMVQKEVAERICARVGQMSILAVSVQYYAKPELLFYVNKKSFFPVPEVDSAVIKISKINNQQIINNKEEVKHFFRIVKAGFSAKRKTLVNNLSASLKLDKKEVEEKLKKIGITPNQRAQELSVEDWKKIAMLIYE